ncbi:hypothetical protein ACFL6C_11820 [Myxococcota bacterium]
MPDSRTGYPTRQELESVDGCAICLPGPFGAEFVDEAQELLLATLEDAVFTDGLALGSLRGVLVAADVTDTITYWQKQIGEPEGTSSTSYVMVKGKALTWRSEPEQVPMSVVILWEGVILGTLRGASSTRALIYHELGHVHDHLRILETRGYRCRRPSIHENAVLTFMAETAWNEYAAETVASRQHTAEDRTARVGYSNMVLSRLQELDELKDQFFEDDDETSFWQNSISAMAHCLNILATVLAALCPRGEKTQELTQFLDQLEDQAGWRDLALGFANALLAVHRLDYDWPEDVFSCVEEIILDIWYSRGILVRTTPGGLEVQVRA